MEIILDRSWWKARLPGIDIQRSGTEGRAVNPQEDLRELDSRKCSPAVPSRPWNWLISRLEKVRTKRILGEHYQL